MGGSASVPVSGGTVPVSVVDTHKLKLRLKLAIVDEDGVSENCLMLLSTADPSAITLKSVLSSAEQLYLARTGKTISLNELSTEDNFHFPAGDSLAEYLRDNDKLIARAAPAKLVQQGQPPLLPSVPQIAATTSGTPVFFCSYCWQNSKEAEKEKEVDKAVGVTDPRQIQAALKTSGLHGWLDKEQLGKQALFDQVCSTLLSARAVVAFVSDEYATCQGCSKELVYAAKTLRLPIIPVVVGTGMDWQKTEIGTLLAGCAWIDMRNGSDSEEGLKQLQARLAKIVGDDVDEEAYRQLANSADPNEPKAGDGFEVLCHYTLVGSLNFDREFSQDITYYRKTGQSTDGGPASLLSDYWWPVTILEVQGDRVKVKYAAYEDWDDDMCWFSKSDLRPVQYATRNVEVAKLAGRSVEAKLHQNGSYCWVAGTVTQVLKADRCVVEFPVVEPSESEGTRVLSSRAEGTKVEDVLVNAAEINVAQLRLL